MISIIVIVKNDPGIETTISTLIEIPKPEKTEIIVVDASEGKLDYIRDKFPEVRWIDFIPKKKITIPEQRNVGVKSAKGNIIVFIDASCSPEKEWLENLIKPILQENESIVTGITNSTNESTFHDQSSELNKGKKYLHEAATINLAVKKEIIEHIGIFDESFEYGSDVDFTWRSIDAGYKIRYEQNAIVSHDWGSFLSELKRSYRYGRARTRLYEKHKHRWRNLFRYDIVTIIYPLFILFSPITLFWPYYPLLLIIPIFRNRKYHPLQTTIDHLVYGIGVICQIIYF